MALWQAAVLGDALDLRSGRTGRVHSVFDHAVNLLIDTNLWTILGDADRLSPFSIALAHWPDAGIGARAGDAVQIRAGFVGLGANVVDCRAVPCWSGQPWANAAGRLEQRLTAVEAAARARAWAGTAPLVARLSDALGRGLGVDDALAQMVGCGPGLTPSGDDAIVGVLAGLHLSPDVKDGPQMARHLADALAPRLAGTTDISRHLLMQAAQGHISRPLHHLGAALQGSGDLPIALTRVLSIGATSGADACLGLVGALQGRMIHAERIAA